MGKKKALSITAIVIFTIFVIYQLYASFYSPVTTEIVLQQKIVEGIDITGYFIRNEELISSTKTGALHFEVEDGERIAAGGVIADIYANGNQSIAATRMAEIKKEIANIENIQKYNDLNAVDISLLNSKIYGALNKIVSTTHTGRYTDISATKAELLTLINRRQIATGQSVNFSSQISLLNDEYTRLASMVGQPTGSIKSEKSGYFLSSIDGYENVLKPGQIENITPETISELKSQENTDDSVIGKLVSDYKWYIAATVSLNDSIKFKQGDELSITTYIKSNPQLNATVERINMSPSSEKAVIVLSCQEINGELASMRTANMKIVLNEYSGLKVSSNALRVVSDELSPDKSQTGVYILSGMTANFVPVNIVYSTDNFALCEIQKEDGKLRLYDEIITKGKNIYDGKIID